MIHWWVLSFAHHLIRSRETVEGEVLGLRSTWCEWGAQGSAVCASSCGARCPGVKGLRCLPLLGSSASGACMLENSKPHMLFCCLPAENWGGWLLQRPHALPYAAAGRKQLMSSVPGRYHTVQCSTDPEMFLWLFREKGLPVKAAESWPESKDPFGGNLGQRPASSVVRFLLATILLIELGSTP